MSIQKDFKKDATTCTVTFTLDSDACRSAKVVTLVGDFNGWDAEATPMVRGENGDFSVAVDLPCGRTYEYRYLVDGSVWENDWHADRYVPAPYGSDNSVVDVEVLP